MLQVFPKVPARLPVIVLSTLGDHRCYHSMATPTVDLGKLFNAMPTAGTLNNNCLSYANSKEINAKGGGGEAVPAVNLCAPANKPSSVSLYHFAHQRRPTFWRSWHPK